MTGDDKRVGGLNTIRHYSADDHKEGNSYRFFLSGYIPRLISPVGTYPVSKFTALLLVLNKSLKNTVLAGPFSNIASILLLLLPGISELLPFRAPVFPGIKSPVMPSCQVHVVSRRRPCQCHNSHASLTAYPLPLHHRCPWGIVLDTMPFITGP